MSRARLALLLFAAAAVTFGVALASILASDFHVHESAWFAGGFFLTAVALVVERLTP